MAVTADRRSTPAVESIFVKLAGTYPRTVAAFSIMPGGDQALRAIVDLERRWKALPARALDNNTISYVPQAKDLPACDPADRFDVIVAGGGLGLVAGAALAARGLRVMVFDRDSVGAAHREWNISERELEALTRWRVFSREELSGAISNHYTRGVISFDGEGIGVPYCPVELEGVLDVALDAQEVLDLARARFLSAGGTLLERRRFVRLHVAEEGHLSTVFELQGPNGREFYGASLAVDMMGSISPIAMELNGGVPFNGVCPTVGTVSEDLDLDPTTGDVLVSVAPVQGGRQLIWEGFPGAGNERTVYVFYYDRVGAREAMRQGLLELFEKYFELLPTYRKASAGLRHLRPVFGYIPARHGRAGRTAARGVICLGDSAAGQSPLTFCGFGSFIRHIGRVSALIDFALRHDLLEERHLRQIGPQQANLRVAWVFSRFLEASPGRSPHSINRIMNVFGAALNAAGPETTVRFLQDRYTFSEYLRIMLLTARVYPGIFLETARLLGPKGLLKWTGDIAAFAADEALSSSLRILGGRRARTLERFLARRAPSAALALAARRTGWQASR